jgi:RNA polymerase sigma factor (sigma-70 family)
MEETLEYSQAVKIVRSVLFQGSPVSIDDLTQEAQIAYMEARNHPEHGDKRVFVIGRVRTRIRDCARQEVCYRKFVRGLTVGSRPPVVWNAVETKEVALEYGQVAPEPETIVTPENFDWLMSVVDKADAETQAIVRGYLYGKTFVQLGKELSLSRQTVSRRLSEFIQQNKREE